MAQEVCTCVGLSGADMSGRLVQIEETHGTSAGSSVLCSVLWQMSQTQTSLILLTLHHTETHYQSVCKKLGFSLSDAEVLDPFRLLLAKDGQFSNIDLADTQNLQGLFFAVEQTVNSKPGVKKALVVDDLSGLVSLGASVGSVVTFVQQCRALQKRDKELSLVVCNHVTEDSEDLKMLSSWLSHVADFRLRVAGLKTGFSANVTGSLEVVDYLKDCNFAEHRMLHFKLNDRQIKVFAPGSVGIRS